ncbi:MAG: hypothetical protein QOH81_750 [Sphingomonadales bacterium]|nr:hypothetical protein [Sphingomonadales bacterium]
MLLSVAAVTPAAAQSVVTSPGPESVSVTVYRNAAGGGGEMDLSWLSGYALITETRTVNLPAGASVIRFEGVAGGILPVSAIIRGLPRAVAEKNHDARLLSAGALVDASLGRQVHIRRTSRATGRVAESEAIIRSGPDGIVLHTAQGIEALRCSGLPETLVYDEAPSGLSAKPTLAVTTSSDAPVSAILQLSYLAGQFDWRANYVANIAPDGRTLDLFAWLTLANANDESFIDAGAQVVAGRPNRVDGEGDEGARPVSPEINLHCWPAGTTSDLPYRSSPPAPPPGEYDMADESIVITGSRMSRMNLASSAPVTVVTAELEGLGDLKLYRIPIPVTVAANAQKQVALLHLEHVRFERLYGAFVDAVYEDDEDADPRSAAILFRTRNVEARGLGRPLPSGAVGVFEQAGGRPMLVGEAAIQDTSVGEDLEILVGESPDVSIRHRLLPEADGKTGHANDRDKPHRHEIVISNAKASAADIEIKFNLDEEAYRLIKPSRKLGRKNGRSLWLAHMPANGTVRLVYTLERRPVRRAGDDSADGDGGS